MRGFLLQEKKLIIVQLLVHNCCTAVAIVAIEYEI